jgi:hypothetical protein
MNAVVGLVIAAVVVLGAIGALSDPTSDEGGDVEPTGTTGEPTATSTTTTTPPLTLVIVPNVEGEQTGAARDLLKEADLAAFIEQKYSQELRCRSFPRSAWGTVGRIEGLTRLRERQ